ncbi:hypothetical protein EDC14_100924 [Hydrogenispora ethanolica]|uniref:Uncharacterized protein n=1 Tax=Hydrogenispora ethanolica TaxID=1082276 RepID=A0A4V2QF65_HYDET|nr:DUF6144 family protein [Hydrogenispora ethanolica]TCL70707.1 hypothetical protein EDC14_100924 [Hydrogenispora ethanolica]
MHNALKHYLVLRGQLDKAFGKEKSREILRGLDGVDGSESPEQASQWAKELVYRLEENIEKERLVTIRENCTCIKCNKYSPLVKKFQELRKAAPDDDTYLREVVNFLNGRGRCGKKVGLVDGKIISHFAFSDHCSCHVVKDGWKAPPSVTWCHCCKGSLLSVYQYVFVEKICKMEIVETFATGGKDCVFATYYMDSV